jgi:hypothetical protein
MSMSYREECPSNYEPSGFADATDHNISPKDWDTLWEEETSADAIFSSALHHVRVAARGSDHFGPTASEVQDSIMSKQLQNMQTTSSSRNHGLQSTVPPPLTVTSDDRQHSPVLKSNSGQIPKGNKGIKNTNPAIETTETSQRIDAVVANHEPEAAKNTGRLTSNKRPRATESFANVTPRKRRKSVSKIYVAVGGSSPSSQIFTGAVEPERGHLAAGRSFRSSSTDSDLR